MIYSNGQVISSDDIAAAGSMQIGDGVMSQSFNIAGQQMSVTASYGFLPLKPMGGVLHLNDSTGQHNGTV